MDRRSADAYVREIVNQEAIAADALARLYLLLESPPRSTHSIFGAAQAIMTAAAQMSKLFWADLDSRWTEERREFAKSRAKYLRRALKPDELLSMRKVRNSIEHFDSRLDDLLIATPDINIADLNVAPEGAIRIGGVFLRHLDNENLTLKVLDVEANLIEVMTAMNGVAERAEQWLEESLRLMMEEEPG